MIPIPAAIPFVGYYEQLWRLEDFELLTLLCAMHYRATGNLQKREPRSDDYFNVLWQIEEELPVHLRRLYYRELLGKATRFDENNGNCLGSDAYEWTIIHPSAKDRAKALASTYLIAMLKLCYDEGADVPTLDGLRDTFSDQASEAGCGYELDHDSEDYAEKRFAELFAPLEVGYKP